MARSIDTIDSIVTNLQARVNQLDGQGLSDQAQATVNQLMAEINGLRTTVNQAVLGMESDRQSLRDDLTTLTTLVQAHLGSTGS